MMNSKYYIAYGSNLSIKQMQFRTPDARLVGTAVLEGWRLLFRRYATIEKAQGFNTPVLVWKISEQDEKNLDCYEGYPRFYKKRNLKISVKSFSGNEIRKITAMVYIMTQRAAKMNFPAPSDDYCHTIATGYSMFNFDRNILEEALKECGEQFL